MVVKKTIVKRKPTKPVTANVKRLGFFGSKKITLNDDDRAQWIDNDEGLYNWWRRSRLSKREFIKENRKELTELIMAVINKEPGK